MKKAFTLILLLCSFYHLQAQTREAFNWGTEGHSYVTCYDTPNFFCPFPASWTSGNIISQSGYRPITTTITTSTGTGAFYYDPDPMQNQTGTVVFSSGPEAKGLSFVIRSTVNPANAFLNQTFTFSEPICDVKFVIQGIIGGFKAYVQDQVIISATDATGASVVLPSSITASVDASVSSGSVITGTGSSLGGDGNTTIAFSGCIKSLSLTLRVPSGAVSPFDDGVLRTLIYPNDITFVPIQALPVRLSSFNATPEKSAIRLNWQTVFETNADHFSVQRSKNALEFSNLTTIKSAGESNKPIDYDYLDETPEPGTNYYRLWMLDKDGSSSFSQIVSCRSGDVAEMSIYPNPSSGNFYLKASEDIISYRAASILGENVDVLITKNGNDHQVTFPGKPTQGIYLLTVLTAKGLQKYKVVIE